ncbi:MAG TPA: hypothetical protein VMP89_03375 [Solirubrobacteraceae bacterium]|nr:hypothetical protein [Solirubrobacteraceae bacterium]
MGRSRSLVPAITAVALAVLAPAAFAKTAPAASAKTVFHPRVGHALGLFPPVGGRAKLSAKDVASGALTQETYHGGSVMAGGVTVHTVFWAPPGYSFQGSPGGSVPTYEGLVQQFFTDVAHDSGAGGGCTNSGCNAFSVLTQYAEGTAFGQVTPGAYGISYNAAADSIAATDPYPSKSQQCASPAGTATCVTDGQVQSEIDHLIQSGAGARGLNDLWFVFLPPGVDECIDPGMCGTNAFAGYHSVSDVSGHGVTAYAVAIDPIIESPVAPGADPQGYPDAEVTLDVAAHETVEAMTDPEGAGWMDPNGFEVGDKCESGPQTGTPLGFASDGSPYDQVINGHQYLIQDMWANLDSSGNPGCVQSTSDAANQLPLPQVNLRQFNPVVTGNVNRAAGGGIGVRVTLLRMGPSGAPVAVARASTTTSASGGWSVSLAPHAPGDDRDEIDVDYSGANAPQPTHQVILTGNGGNPFTEAGWTGWTALDTGAAVHSGPSGGTLTLAPCFQAGILSYTFDGPPAAQSPTDLCNTQTDAATVNTPPIGRRDVLAVTSNDNRAFADPTAPTPNPVGGLVSLTVRVGEPAAVSAFTNPLLPFFTPTGAPQCLADLEFDAVECIGLVPKQAYTLTDGRQRQRAVADSTGAVVVPLLVSGGNLVSLSNGSRTLTVLHVAHLRVEIAGEETVIAAGRCQAGQYFGAPPNTVPTSTSAGLPTNIVTGGTALTGEICPNNGDATGLPTTSISQTDERSGGVTETEVPDIEDTSPVEGETVYGQFTALAESGLPGPANSQIPTDPVTAIGLSIQPVSGGAPVFSARNVDTLNGVAVGPLRVGNYIATWTLIDSNGDVRLAQTRFFERAGRGPAPARTGISCKLTGKRHNLVRCAVTFANTRASGTVRVRITRGGHVVALGQGKVGRGKATVTMRELRRVSKGAWRVTLVLSQHKQTQTTVLTPKTLF